MKFNFRFVVSLFIVLYMLLTAFFYNFYKQLAIKDTKNVATSILNSMNAIRTYIETIQRPVLYDLIDSKKSSKYFDSRLLSSTYISQYIYDVQREKNEINYEYKLVATNPLNPIHMATPFEEKILNKFRTEEIKEYFSMIEENDKSYFFIAKPTSRNTSDCLQCHGNPKDAPTSLVEVYGDSRGFYEKVGELRAMIYVKIPVNTIIESHKQQFLTGGSVMFFALIGMLSLIFSIFKKNQTLQHRKDKLIQHQNRLAVMGSMIGNISHQWKQPLTHLSSMFINLELMCERGKLTNEKLMKKLEEGANQISFMSNTIDDFKNFFSPKTQREECNIEKITNQSIRLLKFSLDKHSINIILDLKENFNFKCNENEIVQIFINIINNAKDAFVNNNKKNREIFIKSFITDNKKVITIQNNAGQIPKDVIDKIFNPYFSTKDMKEASGIGLYICKFIIESYNGKILVENIDDGVIFKIEINC